MSILYVCFYFFTCYAAYSPSPSFAQSIHGCGGFIEASPDIIKSRRPTDTKLDYSHITVELQTLDGLVKDRAQCAPNGYYFIPVYDKGSFTVKVNGPNGWSWDPIKVPVIVDKNGCNSNEDINFRFTGFTISGKIIGAVGGESCTVKNGGPSNVNVDLLSQENDIISSVLTTGDGKYLFQNIIPGKYKLGAYCPDLKIEVRGSREVELGFLNTVADDIFHVRGYDISGFVVAQGNPVLGVHIYLHSSDIMEIDCPLGAVHTPTGIKALCHAISDANGMFKFNMVPCGSYELVPYYKGEHTVFDVSPSSISLSVEHNHVSVKQKFQVTGFSIGGRVIDGNGMGVDGAEISVDGNKRSLTDESGYYKLDQVTSNHYTIVAKKEHYKFSSLNEFLVLPNMASISDIMAFSYDVCGVVHITFDGSPVKVSLTHGPENSKPQVRRINGSGRFCFEALPGEYRISAMAVNYEDASTLLFHPYFHDVVVKSPVLDVEFHQALVNLEGTVICKENCNHSVMVTLTRDFDKNMGEMMTNTRTDRNGRFLFSKVVPGKYTIEVSHYLSDAKSKEDTWCWIKKSLRINVGNEDINDITFVHKGYRVNIYSSHEVHALLNHTDGLPQAFEINKGFQNFCIEFPGVHELHFCNSCIWFGGPFVMIDTSNLVDIYLEGKKYIVKGSINVELSSLGAETEPPNTLKVDIDNEEGVLVNVSTAKLVTSTSQDENILFYEYSAMVNLGDELYLVPHDSRYSGEKKILFYPKKHHVFVTNDGCQSPIPTFYGRLGLYIEGSVSPPLSDVGIKITSNGNLPSLGDGVVVSIETTTNIDGVFSGGPLYDDIDYTMEAYKAGYHFKPSGLNSFYCQKLGQIVVNVLFERDSEENVPRVLLSLSGEGSYRNNSVTGDGGYFSFDNLFPGTFYLRPLLKEFAFLPQSQTIELGSGESIEVIFQASRVAYSATGLVTLLPGQPREGVSVEAISTTKGFYEEAITDSFGNFRLRGLLPDLTYIISIAKKENQMGPNIERSSPESVSVMVGSEDIKGLNFIIFEQPERTILSGHVEQQVTDFQLLSHLQVEVRYADEMSEIVSLLPLPPSHFFQLKDLQKKRHLVRLICGLSMKTHKFESEVIEVDLEKTTQIHIGPLKYRFYQNYHKQEPTPAPVYPLITGILVAAAFISVPRFKELFETGIARSTMGLWNTNSKKEIRRKRTY